MELSKLQAICKTEAGKNAVKCFAPLLTQIMPIWGLTHRNVRLCLSLKSCTNQVNFVT